MFNTDNASYPVALARLWARAVESDNRELMLYVDEELKDFSIDVNHLELCLQLPAVFN